MQVESFRSSPPAALNKDYCSDPDQRERLPTVIKADATPGSVKAFGGSDSLLRQSAAK